MTRSNSLLARIIQIRNPATTGDCFAPTCHIRNDARTKLAAIRIDQESSAGSQGSNAMGATIKLVGKYMYCDIS
jgi:hypothetical protein